MALKRAEAHTARVIDETEAIAGKAVDRLRSDFPEWDITSEVVTGTPTWELIDAATSFGADLVVVGSERRSAIGRLFLGSVAKRLATDALCSVRVSRPVVPRGEAGTPRIIIGVDGSPASEEAIYAVGHRVWLSGTEVRLVAVDDGIRPDRIALRLPQAAAMVNNYLQSRETRVSSMLEWAGHELGNVGLKTSIVTERGDAKEVLLDQARKWEADSIFVGTRDFSSAFERFRLGSISTAVVTNAHCSVEIVRPTLEPEG
jgi:nucleotide-binding universal stress UspA family protein